MKPSVRDAVGMKCIASMGPRWSALVAAAPGWRTNGAIAWRTRLPLVGTPLPNPEAGQRTLSAGPGSPLTMVCETVSTRGGDFTGIVMFETDDGRAIAINAKLAPLLDGLRPMLMDSDEFHPRDCAVAGVDEDGITQAYVMEYRL